MASPWQQFINTELQKRIGVGTVPATGNATPNTIPRFTGTGLTIEETWPNPFANVFTVAKSGAQFTTIQAAIDAASPPPGYAQTLIKVYPGFYNENLTINDKNIIIEGNPYPIENQGSVIIQCNSGNLITYGTTYGIVVFKHVTLRCGYTATITDNGEYISLVPTSDTSIFYLAVDPLSLWTTERLAALIDCYIELSNCEYTDVPSPYRIKLIKNVTDDPPYETLYFSCLRTTIGINEAYNYGETDWAYITGRLGAHFIDCTIVWSRQDDFAAMNGTKTTFIRHTVDPINWSYAQDIKFIRCKIVFESHHPEHQSTKRTLVHFTGTGCRIVFDSCDINLFNYSYGRVFLPDHKMYLCVLEPSVATFGEIKFLNNIVTSDGVTNVYTKQLIILKKPPVAPTWSYINSHNDFSLATFVESGDLGIMINDGVPEDVITSNINFNDPGSVGGVNTFARANHRHGMPRNPIVYASQAPTNPQEGDLWIQS